MHAHVAKTTTYSAAAHAPSPSCCPRLWDTVPACPAPRDTYTIHRRRRTLNTCVHACSEAVMLCVCTAMPHPLTPTPYPASSIALCMCMHRLSWPANFSRSVIQPDIYCICIYTYKTLFGCSKIRINPHVSSWVRVELELNSTSIHSNTCGLRWIRQHPNKA
jgi:hypothetical protein